MKNSVVIKGNKYGIIVMLDKNIPFDNLLADIAEKFKESSKFLGNSSMGITFEGRFLDNNEIRQVLDTIADNSDLNIVCVVDNDKEREEYFKKSVDQHLNDLSNNDGQFYRGTLRSGQVIESGFRSRLFRGFCGRFLRGLVRRTAGRRVCCGFCGDTVRGSRSIRFTR